MAPSRAIRTAQRGADETAQPAAIEMMVDVFI
jgi:hypothetical protein